MAPTSILCPTALVPGWGWGEAPRACSRALDMQSKQQLDKHPGDRQMRAPPSPAAYPTVLRAGPASPSRIQATSLPPHTAAQPLPLPGLLHTAQLRQPLERESPRPVHRCDTRTHTRAHTVPPPAGAQAPPRRREACPEPRPASQDPGLSLHLPDALLHGICIYTHV